VSDAPRLLTPKQVAQLLQVSVKTIRRQLDGGALAHVKVGDQIRFRPEDVKSYIDGNVTRRPGRPARQR
jgi:excisionase family DNA binding protein